MIKLTVFISAVVLIIIIIATLAEGRKETLKATEMAISATTSANDAIDKCHKKDGVMVSVNKNTYAQICIKKEVIIELSE